MRSAASSPTAPTILAGFSLSITEFSELMRRAAVFTAVVVVGGFALRSIISNLGNLTSGGSNRIKGQLSAVITPNDEF